MVRDNKIDQALRVLKKKMQREGVFREMKRRRFYEKPSERSAREQNEALRRARKLAQKKAQREGLLPPSRCIFFLSTRSASSLLDSTREVPDVTPQAHTQAG